MTDPRNPFRDVFGAPRHSSLSEEDYREPHGQPGGAAAAEPRPQPPEADSSRFDYPGIARDSYRSGTTQ